VGALTAPTSVALACPVEEPSTASEADIGTTAVIGHPVVMSLRWRLDSTFDLVAAYSLETEFCLTARNTASARLSSKRARTRIELAFRAKSVLVERSRK
jgi:hypothetical protein